MKSNNEPYNEPTCANYTFHVCGIQKPKSEKSLSPNYLSLDYIYRLHTIFPCMPAHCHIRVL